MARTTQRDVMRGLDRRFDGDLNKVVAAYAAAERRGDANRTSNVRGMSPEEYAVVVKANPFARVLNRSFVALH